MKIHKFEKYLDVFFRDITSLGSFAFHFFLILFIAALGQLTLVWQLLFSFFFTLIATTIIRMFYFKDRPHKQTHANFIEKIDAASFPSLHTARTVAMVMIVLNAVQKNAVTIFLVGFSALIIYSRVYLKKHDWEDVAGGIILGVVTFFLALLV
ncbi:phosphatase PAP2 family protein [Candidatus Woesearchaeota archaeon]|nr:phosphatase PAP2 family protein [Candidatus Woesearchaeota archaeon]